MRWHGWMTWMLGVAVGAGTIALLPAERLFVATASSPAAGVIVDGSAAERWACPMLDYIGPKTPDNKCPVCGMTLHQVEAGALTAAQQERLGVTTVQAVSGPATVTVRAYGAAEYDDRFTQVVIPRVAGRIVKRHEATFGLQQELAVGAPLVDLFSPEVFNAQGELQAAHKTGAGDLVRAIQERFARWNLSPVADAILAGGSPVDTVTIRSPFAGQPLMDAQDMVNEALTLGRMVSADTPLVKLVDPRRLTLVVHVPEPRVHLLRAGQPVRLASDDLGELPDVEAVIGRVAQEINAKIRAREVRIHLLDGRRHLLPGSLVQARFRVPLAPDLTPADPEDKSTWGTFVVIPKTAVLSTGVRHVAWRVAGKKDDGSLRFEPVSLALGPRLEDEAGNDRVIVRAGLKAGDDIAVGGLFLIDSQAQLAGSPSLLFPDGAVQAAPAGHVH